MALKKKTSNFLEMQGKKLVLKKNATVVEPFREINMKTPEQARLDKM